MQQANNGSPPSDDKYSYDMDVVLNPSKYIPLFSGVGHLIFLFK